MAKAMLDYNELAHNVDTTREVIRAVVAGLMDDGFTDEQARVIVTGAFHTYGNDKTGSEDG